MAHEPRLEVFTIYLKNTPKNSVNTFADYLEKQFHSGNGKVNHNSLFKNYFEFFLKKMDNTYHKDDKRKKAIGVKPKTRGGSKQNSISYTTENTIIEGTIKGGRYGQNRYIGDTDKPEKDHKKLGTKDIVLDDFYFLLYTPYSSNKGILILQSYSDDSIKDIFIGFLREILKAEGFYKPDIVAKCPQFIIDEFKKNSIVNTVIFRDDILLSNIEDGENIVSKDVVIEVKISNVEGVGISSFPNIRKFIEKISITRPNTNTKLTLNDFNTKIGTLASGTHMSSFKLNSDFEIQPMIPLEDKITLQSDRTPDWESLKSYCLELLEDVKNEVYPENATS